MTAVDMAKRDLRNDISVLADLAERVSNIAVDMPSMVFVVLGEIARLEAELDKAQSALEAVSPLVGAEWRQLSSERQQAWLAAYGGE